VHQDISLVTGATDTMLREKKNQLKLLYLTYIIFTI